MKINVKSTVVMASFWGCTLLGQAYALSTENACATLSESLNTAAQQHHLKSIAVLPFMANGKLSNDISEELRDLSLEKLSDYPAIDVFDRKEMRLVATESGISCPESKADTASAFLAAEVFYAEGDPVGYMSYRLIQTSDSRVLAAGFLKLDWDEAQRGLFSGANRTLRSGQLPLIPESDAETVASKTASIQDNVALVYEGSDSKDNTLAARMAFAQIQTWLIQNGRAVFEREFFRDVATEKSLNDDVANSGDNITVAGHIKMKKKDDSSNRVTIQFFTLSNHKNLATFSLIQSVTSDAVANMQGDDGENALAQRRKNRIQAQNESVANIEFIHHFEIVFTEEERKNLEQIVDRACDIAQNRCPNWGESDQLAYVKLIVYDAIWKDLQRKVCAALAKKLNLRDVSLYTTPLLNIALKFNKQSIESQLDMFGSEKVGFMLTGENFQRLDRPTREGTTVKIKRSVDWKNGVPYKIIIDVDLSTRADEIKRFILYTRTSNNH